MAATPSPTPLHPMRPVSLQESGRTTLLNMFRVPAQAGQLPGPEPPTHCTLDPILPSARVAEVTKGPGRNVWHHLELQAHRSDLLSPAFQPEKFTAI